MAIVGKEARNINFILSRATHMGPGKYTGSINTTQVEESIVPFHTSVPRKFMVPEGPDPAQIERVKMKNEFEYESELIKEHIRKPIPNKSFASKIKRLPTQYKENAPDPGTFYSDPMLKQQEKQDKANTKKEDMIKNNNLLKANREKNFRNVTRSSIPAKKDKYGYTYIKNDEDENVVDVVANFNPFIIGGDNSDCVGPGHYDINYKKMDNNKKGTKIRYDEKNPRFKVDPKSCGPEIGPGIYDTGKKPVPNYKFKGTSNFLNHNIPRSVLEFDTQIYNKNIQPLNDETLDEFEYIPNCIPGPGSYNTSDVTSFKDKNYYRKRNKFGRLRKKMRSFNICCPRFDENTNNENPKLGPGVYDDEKKREFINHSFNHKQVPFNTEQLREYEKEKAQIKEEFAVPGPGHYNNPNDMVQNLTKKLELYKRRNKAKSDYLSQTAQIQSDLSQQNIHNKIIPLSKRNASTNYPDPTFISTATGRQNPGPGTYYNAHNNPLKSDSINNYTFVSGLDRFKVADKDVPPLGTYDVDMKDVGRLMKKANNLPFNSAVDKFNRHNNFMTHHIDPQNPLLKEKDAANVTENKVVKENEVKYKFSGAFGGGFRGGLVVDEGKMSGEAAPFGANKHRFDEMFDDTKGNYGVIEKEKLANRGKQGPGDYFNEQNYEKKSYNILYI